MCRRALSLPCKDNSKPFESQSERDSRATRDFLDDLEYDYTNPCGVTEEHEDVRVVPRDLDVLNESMDRMMRGNRGVL